MRIDWWTLALQTINVLILVWILARFFYRPVAEIIEKRRAAAAKLLTDAAAAQAAVDADKTAIAAARAGFAAERDRLLADARKQAESDRDALLKKVVETAAATRAENAAALLRDRKMIEQAMVERASALAVEIAQKLLETLPADLAVTSFVGALSDQIGALPAKSRERLANAARASGLDITTAAPLDEPQKAECQKLIEDLLRTKTELTFHADPALIAGIEICSDTVTLKNNWRDALSAILQQLGTDDGQHPLS